MAELDDLVLIEVDDFLPSSHLSSRTASPIMSDVSGHHPLNSEGDQFYQDLHNSGEPNGRQRSSIKQPQTAKKFATSPPPPPPSSQSLGPTPPNGEHAASSPGMDVGIPFPIIDINEDRSEKEAKSLKGSVGLQFCQPKSKPSPKGCSFPVTLHNGRAFNPNRRRRCAFNDAPPPPPPPPLLTNFWPKDPEGRPRDCGLSPILPPVGGMPKDIFNLPPPPSGRKLPENNFNSGLDHPPAFTCPIPPPPPPPPFCGGPSINDFPCPLPPKYLSQPELYSSLELRCPRYESAIDRIVKLPMSTSPKRTRLPSRMGNLLHHRASPFDLHNWLWLLKYGEPECWYARPAEAELARLRRFEANGLGSDLVDLVARCGGEEPAPSTAAPVVKVWVGEVMGASQGQKHWNVYQQPTVSAIDAQRRLENEFLVYYSVVEAPSQPGDEDYSGDGNSDRGPRMISHNAFDRCESLAGGRKVYKLERTGNVDACLARAWHNAVFNGWSTVFSCVVAGDVDFVQADRQGLGGVNAFERASSVGKLLERDPQGLANKTKIFY